MSEFPAPEVTELTRPYWDALAEGELRFQRCQRCSNAWLPPRDECPRCLEADWRFEASTGRGTLISWVVYHRAFNSYFTQRLPYHVAVVALDEGPRMITNLLVASDDKPGIDQPVELVIEQESGWSLARFRLSA